MKVAIIGAGVSGLAAAWAMREIAGDVTVFEKSRGVSGRAASRTRHGARFDYGANYFKTGGEEVGHLVHEVLPTEGLVDIGRDVWTFDFAGVIRPGDPKLNGEPKWVYAGGISTLGKRLAEASGVEVRRETQVEAIDLEGEMWVLRDARGNDLGGFDRVLLTPPAPQAAGILESGGLPRAIAKPLIGALGVAKYHRQFCFVFGFDVRLARPGDFYALINSDGGHAISWLSFEDDKGDRIQSGKSVVVVQMSPAWSLSHFEEEPGSLLPVVFEKMRDLLGAPVTEEYAWGDFQRWKFAHPRSRADLAVLDGGRAHGLYFAGDALVGIGRVGLAMETGLRAGRAILESVRPG